MFVNKIYLSSLPPIKNKYISNLNIPLIGEQKIVFERISRNTAKINISGKIINNEGYVYYHKENTNKYNYEFSDNLTNLMNKYRISISNINYDEKSDISSLEISIKLLKFKRKIIFKRNITC